MDPINTSGPLSGSLERYGARVSAIHACHGNDPSAGSPTETLLRLLQLLPNTGVRLLLPLSGQI